MDGTKKIRTLCRDCIFIEYGEDFQNGCSVNKLQKYINRNKAEIKLGDNFYTIDGFCNFCRNNSWRKKHLIEVNDVEDAKYQVRVEWMQRFFDVVLPFNEEYDIGCLISNVEYIGNRGGINKPNTIWISIPFKFKEKTKLIAKLNRTGVNYKISASIGEMSELKQLHLVSKQSKSLYSLLLLHNKVDFEFGKFATLYELVYEQMKSILLVKKSDEELNKYCVFNKLFRNGKEEEYENDLSKILGVESSKYIKEWSEL